MVIVAIALNLIVLIYVLGVIPSRLKKLSERIEVVIKNQKTIHENTSKKKEVEQTSIN